MTKYGRPLLLVLAAVALIGLAAAIRLPREPAHRGAAIATPVTPGSRP